MTDLRNQHNALKDQVSAPAQAAQLHRRRRISRTPKPSGAVDEAQRRNKKFSIVGVNIGPTYRRGTHGQLQFQRTRRSSSRRSAATARVPCRRRASTCYYPGRQEGQFDLGLVNRWGNMQAGAFGSFKYLNFKGYQSGGGLGQAAFMFDYIFSARPHRPVRHAGLQEHRGAELACNWGRNRSRRPIAQVVDQYGGSALVGVWGNAYMQGNLGIPAATWPGAHRRSGGALKLVQPLNEHVAFTAEAG